MRRLGDPLRTHHDNPAAASDFESRNIRVSPFGRTQNGHTARLGFILQGDIAENLNPTGWERISTPETDSIAAKVAGRSDDLLLQFTSGIDVHSVDKMYLGTPIARQKIVDLVTTLHKECLQGEFTLDPSAVTSPPGAEFTVRPILKNQNGRRLYGRKYIWSSGVNETEMLNGTLLPSDSSSLRFRVITPTPTPRTFILDTWPYYVLRENLAVSVPAGMMTMGSYVEKDTSWYELMAANNGGLGDAGIVTPEGDWDGGPTCPSAIRRVYGNTGWAGQAWGDFQLVCRRSYTFSRGQVIDPILAAQVAGYQWQATAPGGTPGGFSGGVTLADSFSIDCGGVSYCVAWAAVRAVNGNGIPLAISDPIPVSGGTSPLAFRAPIATDAPSSSSGSSTLGARRKLAP